MDQPTPAPASGSAPTPAAPTKQPSAAEGADEDKKDDAMLDVEDPELAEALRLSMAEAQVGGCPESNCCLVGCVLGHHA